MKLLAWLSSFFTLWVLGFISPALGTPKATTHTLRIRLPFEAQTLDWTLGDVPISIIQNTMRGLFKVDAMGSVLPDLTQSFKTQNKDRTWIFEIKKGLKWSDGVELEAAHFVQSFKRLLDPKTGSTYAYFLWSVASFEATGTHQLKVELKAPNPALPAILTHWVTFPVREDLILAHPDYGRNPAHMAFLGPFTLSEYKLQKGAVLLAHPYAQPKPWLDRIEALTVLDDETAVNLFQTGKLDIAQDPGTIQQGLTQYLTTPILYYLGLNAHQHPLLKSAKVRQALTLALDLRQIPHLLGSPHRPTRDLLPSEAWKWMGTSPATESAPLSPQVALARKILQQEGFQNTAVLPPLKLRYFNRPMIRDLAQWIAAQLKESLGLQVELEMDDVKSYWPRLKTDPPQIFIGSKGAAYPDPGTYFELFTTPNPQNYGAVALPAYDEWVQEASQVSKPAERKVLYKKAQELLLRKEAAVIPLFFKSTPYLIHSRIQGFKTNPLSSVYFESVHW